MNMNRKPPPADTDALACGAASGSSPRIVESFDLLKGNAEVLIRHEGRTYRLRRTRFGKLILTA